MHRVQISKMVVTGRRRLKGCVARSRHMNLSHLVGKCWQNKSPQIHRTECIQDKKFGIWFGMRNKSACCFIGNEDGVFRAREFRILEPHRRWDKEATNNVIGVPWRMTDGRWTVDRPDTRVDLRSQFFHRHLREDELGGKESPSKTSTNSELVEEVQRGEHRKRRSDDTAAAMLEPEPAIAARDSRESPIEPDPIPKRRLLMKSAPSTANGSGQQREKRPVTDAEPRLQTGDPLEVGTGESTTLPGAPSSNTRRRIVVKSEPVAAVTTQEAVDGYRENSMRIASVEQVELGSIMEQSLTGQVLMWARQPDPT